MARGRLRVYLGAAPGVGKTYEMLLEGHRQRRQGVDCVIGFVEPHGRRATQELVDGLEVMPRRYVRHRGGVLPEMDVDAVLARRPQLTLVDELAHTNAPGSRNPKRWQDVQELLEAGIDVLTTLNIQHLESLGDVLTEMTGVEQRETVPDAVVRQADELELVDLSPEALRRRMVAGDIYPPDRIDAALSHYFRPGNLTGLRELALLWVADRVDEVLRRYRSEHGITAEWEARERIVVGVSGGSESEALIRRAARLAARTPGSDLMAVYVARSDGRLGADPARLATLRSSVEGLGGSWHQVVGADVSSALTQFARHENATQMVIGVSRPSAGWKLLTGREVVSRRLSRLETTLDVHVVTDKTPARFATRLPQLRGVSPRRRLRALALMAVLLPAVTILLGLVRTRLSLPSDLLVYL
ncbi:MAG: universal stress protein, partial [Mycobacterium sp.]|uniref:universal stress protein n=1 Tax=Mycobacterium sp. TaxID=1785 RepID=UPI003F95F385